MTLPVWGFFAVTAPLVLSPGPSTAVVLRNSIGGGTRAGLLTAAGANSGSFCYGVLTAFGFAVAMQRWPSAWLVLRWAGVAYLTWLGLQSLSRVVRARRVVRVTPGAPALGGWRSYTSGFLTNVLNPSLAAFYLIVLPQFVPREAPFVSSVLILTGIHIAMAVSCTPPGWSRAPRSPESSPVVVRGRFWMRSRASRSSGWRSVWRCSVAAMHDVDPYRSASSRGWHHAIPPLLSSTRART